MYGFCGKKNTPSGQFGAPPMFLLLLPPPSSSVLLGCGRALPVFHTMRPLPSSHRPEMARSRLDLPVPEGPVTSTLSPSHTSKFTPRLAPSAPPDVAISNSSLLYDGLSAAPASAGDPTALPPRPPPPAPEMAPMSGRMPSGVYTVRSMHCNTGARLWPAKTTTGWMPGLSVPGAAGPRPPGGGGKEIICHPPTTFKWGGRGKGGTSSKRSGNAVVDYPPA